MFRQNNVDGGQCDPYVTVKLKPSFIKFEMDLFTAVNIWIVVFYSGDRGNRFLRNVGNTYTTTRHHNPEDHNSLLNNNNKMNAHRELINM
jgi:hypothetical protein